MCGASILSSSWILTAAHCVQGVQPSQVVVSAATNELFGWTQWRFASSVIVHPQYDNETIENDIALVEVLRPFNMTDPGIAQICLPISATEDYPPINSTLVAIGWGETTEDGNVSETLQQVTLQRIPYESNTCSFLITNKSMQFCAGVPNDDKDTCYGDSGGPLMVFTSSNQWVIVGIVSYGHGCARAGFAGVYTRVVYYLKWIYSMNVTGVVTVETVDMTTIDTVTMTITLPTTAAKTSKAINKNLLSSQHAVILFYVISILAVSLIV